MIKNNNFAKGCLEEYRPMASPELCPMCNAVDSVVHRLSTGKSLSLEDLKVLPNTMSFDPKNNDPVEYSYGLKFTEIVKSFEQKIEKV